MKSQLHSTTTKACRFLSFFLAGSAIVTLAPLVASADSCTPDLPASALCEDGVKLNDLQSVGSHNSYKLAIPEAELAMIAEANPRAAMTLDYSHIELSQQLDLGLRQIELDILYDPEGGRYSDPLLPRLAREQSDASVFDSEGLDAPGFKVLHAQDIDVRSSCATWIRCLSLIKQWSDENPAHIPLLIMFNAKEGGGTFPGSQQALTFTAQAYAELEREILTVLPREKLIIPDDIRGDYPTLREAVLARGWPNLEQSLGKIIFALDEGPEKVAVYLGQNESAQGKLIFPNSASEDAPHAAYFTLNDSVGQQKRIRQAVQAGFLVRTRADANTFQARENDTAAREAAFASGAHYISTDYYLPRADFSDYSVRLPSGTAARCNPQRSQAPCH